MRFGYPSTARCDRSVEEFMCLIPCPPCGPGSIPGHDGVFRWIIHWMNAFAFLDTVQGGHAKEWSGTLLGKHLRSLKIVRCLWINLIDLWRTKRTRKCYWKVRWEVNCQHQCWALQGGYVTVECRRTFKVVFPIYVEHFLYLDLGDYWSCIHLHVSREINANTNSSVLISYLEINFVASTVWKCIPEGSKYAHWIGLYISFMCPFVHGRLENLKTSEDTFGHDITPSTRQPQRLPIRGVTG